MLAAGRLRQVTQLVHLQMVATRVRQTPLFFDSSLGSGSISRIRHCLRAHQEIGGSDSMTPAMLFRVGHTSSSPGEMGAATRTDSQIRRGRFSGATVASTTNPKANKTSLRPTRYRRASRARSRKIARHVAVDWPIRARQPLELLSHTVPCYYRQRNPSSMSRRSRSLPNRT